MIVFALGVLHIDYLDKLSMTLISAPLRFDEKCHLGIVEGAVLVQRVWAEVEKRRFEGGSDYGCAAMVDNILALQVKGRVQAPGLLRRGEVLELPREKISNNFLLDIIVAHLAQTLYNIYFEAIALLV